MIDFMHYPVFNIFEDSGILPDIRLPEDFLDLVPRFYDQGRKKDVEDYKDTLLKMIKGSPFETEIRLRWDEKLGLKNINIGSGSGLDLSIEGNWATFEVHNIGTYNGLSGGFIAMKYVFELLKSR